MSTLEINNTDVQALLNKLGCTLVHELTNRVGNPVQVWSNKVGAPRVVAITGTDRKQLSWPAPDNSTASAEFVHNPDGSGNTHIVLVEFPPGYNKICRVIRRAPAVESGQRTPMPTRVLATTSSDTTPHVRDIGGVTPRDVFQHRRRASA